MFITRKHISRRTMLRGMGVAVALPFLESMVPAQTPLRKTAATPLSRFAAIEIVHGSGGATMYGTENNLWSPSAEGREFKFTETLNPLEPFRDYTTIISHTDCTGADPIAPGEVGADHFRSSAVFLTGAHPKQTEGSDVYCGTSIDQMYAAAYGQDTPLPSIQLSIENQEASGACGYHYSCVYMDMLSWASPSRPLPMMQDPRLVFEALFGSGGSPEERATRREVNRSILDRIASSVARVRKDLDAVDRSRLDDYLDNVREIERRIQRTEEYNAARPSRELPNAPMGVPDNWEEHVKLMYDLQAVAFAAEITRVATLKLSRDTSQRTYPESGTSLPFHSASHHQQKPKLIEEFARINRYHVSVLPHFLEKLKNTPDGDGSLLDHSLILYGSPMGDSNVHGHKRVPLVLAGHASGQVKGNLHVRAKDDTPQANALLSVVRKLGVDVESVGDSTGTLSI
jgi:hypothetical protein